MSYLLVFLIVLGVIVILALLILAMSKTRHAPSLTRPGGRHRIACTCGHVHYHVVEDEDEDD